MGTEQQLDLLPERPDGYYADMADCKVTFCGCAWEQLGDPWLRVYSEKQQSEAI